MRKLGKRCVASALAAVLAAGMVPLTPEAADGTLDYAGRPAVHDYGKSGDDPATVEDESALVANENIMASAQYKESDKYELKANGTVVSVYKYQKQDEPGKLYHMDVARFSSDDAQPVFEVTLKDGSTIDSVEVYPERYYPQESLQVSADKKTLTFQMSEGLRYCIININGTQDDTEGKPQLAIINDPTETDKPDIDAENVLNFEAFSEQYLEEHPITDKAGEICREAGTVTDTSLNDGTEYTISYEEGKYVDYWKEDVAFPDKRARLSYDVSDAFQAALEEVKNSDTLDTIYFPAGTYVWSGLSIKNWDGNGADGALNIYLDEDALLVNRMQECREANEPAIGIWDSSNITVSGRGIIDGNGTYSKLTDQCHAQLSPHQGGSMVVRSQNITFNDTYVRDAKQWNWECHTGENITYNNIKGLSPYQHSWVDGLDLTSGKNITVNGAITMGNDDTFASGHFNPSNEFPQRQLSGKTDQTQWSEEDTKVAAAAAVYNSDRLEWDKTDNENFTINNTLGWSTYANAIRLGHNTKFKEDGSSYQMRNYVFNNVNTLHVTGWSPNLGGGALSIQNGTNGCNPNYESLQFINCSFAPTKGGNSANIPNGNNLTNFNPKEVVFKNCWFKEAETPFSFKNIDNVTIEDLYLGGKLVEYSSQINLTLGEGDQAVDNFVFTANGRPVIENHLPEFTYPDSDVMSAYAGNPLIFYVKAEDPDEGNTVTFGDVDVSALTGASFDVATGRFSWTPSADDIGKSYDVTFTVSDYTGQPVSKTVKIQVGNPKNDDKAYIVSQDAHVQSWSDEERNRTYGERGYITMSKIDGFGEMGEEYTGEGGNKDGKISYLKFDLFDMGEWKDQFAGATLELTLIGPRYNNAVNTEDSVNVAVVEDSSWSEDSITWKTKPAFSGDPIKSKNFNLGENYGDANKNNSTNVDIAVNGRKVGVDITKFVQDALKQGKTSLSLALCETESKEIYFVSKEGAAGLLKNASADMAPKLLVNLPVEVAVEGQDSMTVYEGQSGESNSYALKGTGPFTVELSGNTGDGKITWDAATQQIKVAEGLARGDYKVTMTVKNASEKTVTKEITVHVIENEKVTAAKEDLQKTYDQYKDKENNNYTAETWKAFQDALGYAKRLLETGNAELKEQDLVDAKNALIEAAGNLTQKPTEPTDPDPSEPTDPDPTEPTDPGQKPSGTPDGSQGNNNQGGQNTGKNNAARTGDETNAAAAAGVCVAALAAGAAAVVIKKRRF